MIREHFIPAQTNTTVYYCSCNYTTLDTVSNVAVSTSGLTFVVDPIESNRYCARKNSNALFPITIWDGIKKAQDGNPHYFRIHGTSSIPSETTTYSFMANDYTGHRVEFDLYLIPNPSSYRGNGDNPSIIFDDAGLGNLNANAQQSGFALGITQHGRIQFNYRNKTSAITQIPIGMSADIGRQWLHCIFTYMLLSNGSQIYCSGEVIDSNDTSLSFYDGVLDMPLVNNRSRFAFFSDTSGSGRWAQDTIDYVKEIKVTKL